MTAVSLISLSVVQLRGREKEGVSGEGEGKKRRADFGGKRVRGVGVKRGNGGTGETSRQRSWQRR
jgi:hypothetical protein